MASFWHSFASCHLSFYVTAISDGKTEISCIYHLGAKDWYCTFVCAGRTANPVCSKPILKFNLAQYKHNYLMLLVLLYENFEDQMIFLMTVVKQ